MACLWLTLFVCAVCAAGGCAVARAQEAQPVAGQERALAVLREALHKEKEFIKVHAAEALLANGYAEGVREVFLAELPAAQLPYRIGVLRVLARAAGKETAEREQYVNQICYAGLKAEATKRVHAIETLAKLGYAERLEAFVQAATGTDLACQGYARWLLANSGQAQDEAALAEGLASENADLRSITAYALRHFKQLAPATFNKLKTAFENEPRGSSARIYLLSATFCHAPEEQKRALKDAFLPYAQTGAAGEKFELGFALWRGGTEADYALLEKLLADPEPDARIGAAHARLGIAARLHRTQD